MFQKMRRFTQEMKREECISLLQTSKRGVLSLVLENGYPYGIPMDHWYNPENGHIYFHGAKEGQKIDAIQKNANVSYCVISDGIKESDSWIYHFQSVVVFGKMQCVEDLEVAERVCSEMCKKFTDDENYLKQELKNGLSRVQCLELIPDYISGKNVKES